MSHGLQSLDHPWWIEPLRDDQVEIVVFIPAWPDGKRIRIDADALSSGRLRLAAIIDGGVGAIEVAPTGERLQGTPIWR